MIGWQEANIGRQEPNIGHNDRGMGVRKVAFLTVFDFLCLVFSVLGFWIFFLRFF